MQRLLARNCDPNVPTKHGTTPLHNAVSHGHDEIAKALVSGGADPNLTNAQGRAAVHGAPEA